MGTGLRAEDRRKDTFEDIPMMMKVKDGWEVIEKLWGPAPDGFSFLMQWEAGHLLTVSKTVTGSVWSQAKTCRGHSKDQERTLDPPGLPTADDRKPCPNGLEPKGKPLERAVKSPRSGLHLGVQTMPCELGFFPLSVMLASVVR